MVKLLDIPETITYSLSNVKLILVTNNYFVEINEVIKGLNLNHELPAFLLVLSFYLRLLLADKKGFMGYQVLLIPSQKFGGYPHFPAG